MRIPNYVPIIAFIAVAAMLYISLKKTTPANDPQPYIYELPNKELKLLNGERLNLKELKGKFYAIHLFATWCSHCKEDYNLLAKLKWDTKIPVVGIAIKDKPAKLLTLKKSTTPYDYIAVDHDMEIAKLLNNRVLPSTIIISPEGTVAFYYVGVLSKEEMENSIIPAIKANSN